LDSSDTTSHAFWSSIPIATQTCEDIIDTASDVFDSMTCTDAEESGQVVENQIVLCEVSDREDEDTTPTTRLLIDSPELKGKSIPLTLTLRG